MNKMNKLSPLLLILILTIETLSLARNYQVARIQGVITKVRGKRVRIQDRKNQIYWVDRKDVIPRKSQIYDEVNFYRKVRFKGSYTPKTTSFLLKYRKNKMLNTLQDFMVNHEKQYGYRLGTQKRTTSVIEKLKSFFKLDHAHASPSPVSDDTCYIGGWKGKYSTTSNYCYVNKGPESSCEVAGVTGFKCNPDVFPAQGSQPSSPIFSLKDENIEDNGICIKSKSNFTQKCYAAYKEIDKVGSHKAYHRVIKSLTDDYARDGDLKVLQESFDEITANCEEISEEEDDSMACDALIEDLEDISQSIIEDVKDQKKKDKKSYISGYADSAAEARNDIERLIKQNDQNHEIIKSLLISNQTNQQRPPVYHVFHGTNQQQPNSQQFYPQVINNAYRSNRPVIVIVVPDDVAKQMREQYTSTSQTQLDAELQKRDQTIAKLKKEMKELKRSNKNTDKVEVEISNEEKKKAQRQRQVEILKNSEYSDYAYAKKKSECKKLADNGGPQLCFVEETDGTHTAYTKYGSNYKESIDQIDIDQNTGEATVDGETIYIEDLGENTDPDLEWNCEVFKDTDADACEVDGTDVGVPVMHMSCTESNSDLQTIGYLSPEQAQELEAGPLKDESTVSFTHSFDGQTKEVTTSSNGAEFPLDFNEDRTPQSFVNQCADVDEKTATIDLRKSCQLDDTFAPISCPHCKAIDKPLITKCVANLKCNAEYKDSYNRTKSSSEFEFKAICDCTIESGLKGVVSDKNTCRLPKGDDLNSTQEDSDSNSSSSTIRK